MPNKPGRGGARPGAGRPRKNQENTAPIRVPESIAKRLAENLAAGGRAVRNALREGGPYTLEEFLLLPTHEWFVKEALPNQDGGIIMRQFYIYGEEADALRAHISDLVEREHLLQGKVMENGKFSIEVFFGHAGWTGDMIGYTIDAAPDQYNFGVLRRFLVENLADPSEANDFVGALIVHQSNSRTIDLGLDGSGIRMVLRWIGNTNSRYSAFQAPADRVFQFKSLELAEEALLIAKTIVERSSRFMEEVNSQFGIGDGE